MHLHWKKTVSWPFLISYLITSLLQKKASHPFKIRTLALSLITRRFYVLFKEAGGFNNGIYVRLGNAKNVATSATKQQTNQLQLKNDM